MSVAATAKYKRNNYQLLMLVNLSPPSGAIDYAIGYVSKFSLNYGRQVWGVRPLIRLYVRLGLI